jgi:5-methyltetrahydropteroyltriglutamate--homocysteine methyltransferase
MRPRRVLDARTKAAAKQIPASELRAIEDEEIIRLARMQEEIGLRAITDGELRRAYFHLDFLERLDGVTIDGAIEASSDAGQTVHFTPPRLSVTGTLRHARNIQVDDFNFLKAHVTQTAKVTIPSPTMVHFRGGRAAIDIKSYPDLDLFFETWRSVIVRKSPRSMLPAADTSSWTTPTSPICAIRRCARARSIAATIPTSCREPMRR